MAEQATQLLLEVPPNLETENIEVSAVVREPWGSPPDDQLVRSVEMCGVLMPIIVEHDADGGFRIVEGRRRFQAAEKAGHEWVPARVLGRGESGVVRHAISLAGNAHTSHNSVADLNAIEELMVATGQSDVVELAKMRAAPLKVLRKRLRLANLNHDLRTAWMEGKFPNAVGEACARLDSDQQRELAKRLVAEGTLTTSDVAAVKRSEVRAHQRTLPDDNWPKRAYKAMHQAEIELFKNGAGESDALRLVREAIVALKDEFDVE